MSTHTLTAKLARVSPASNSEVVTVGSAHTLTAKLERVSPASNSENVAIGVAWDTSEHATCTANPVVFSSNDTVVTMSGPFPSGGSPNSIGLCGRATKAITAKTYWENIVLNQEYGESGVGIIGTGDCPPWPSISPPTAEALLGQNGGVAWATSGGVFALGSEIAGWAPINDGDNVGMAVDPVAKLMWGRVNGGDWNADPSADPATGTGGLDYSSYVSGDIYPGYDIYWSDNNNGGNQSNGPSSNTGIFDAGSFAYTPPSGFSGL